MLKALGHFWRSPAGPRCRRPLLGGLTLGGIFHLYFLDSGHWPARVLEFYPLAALLAGRPPGFKRWLRLRANRVIYTLGALAAIAFCFHFVLAGS